MILPDKAAKEAAEALQMATSIPGFKGYFICKNGVVVSCRRLTPVILKPLYDEDGYLRLSLVAANGKSKKIGIHRLLLITFDSLTYEPHKHPDHINGIKDDNRLENLRWATRSENALNAVRLGGNKIGEQHPRSKLTEEQVRYILKHCKPCKDRHDPKAREFGFTGMGRKFGVSKSAIEFVYHGDHWKHIERKLKENG